MNRDTGSRKRHKKFRFPRYCVQLQRIIMKRNPLCIVRMSKILIVDDSAVVRDRLKQLLAGIGGLEIAEAAHAEHGKSLARKFKPDAIIIDVQLRNGRGIELLQEMKRIDPASRVIVLTNEAYPEIRNRCLAAGADYFFDKSTEYQEMVAVLRSGMPVRSGAH